MKDELEGEMQRWRDRPTRGATVEDRAADLIRGSAGPGEPDPRSLLRVGRDILQPSPRRAGRSLSLRLALIGAALMACVAAVKAYEMVRRASTSGVAETSKAPAHANGVRRRTPHGSRPESLSDTPAPSADVAVAPLAADRARQDIPVASPPARSTTSVIAAPSPRAPSPTRTARVGTAASRLTSKPASGDLPPMAPVAAPPQVAMDMPARATPPAPMLPPSAGTTVVPPVATMSPSARAQVVPRIMPSPSATPAPSASDEVRALDHAIALLRRDHDGAAALSALDAYLARYPHGLLNREARFARVDALLLLGHSEEALSSLETLPLDRGRRSLELQVIRAELLAAKNCAAAETDFSTALGHSPEANLLGRILYGRGVCRAKLGNLRGAASDFRRYLDSFPAGAHSASVREWLKSSSEQSALRRKQ